MDLAIAGRFYAYVYIYTISYICKIPNRILFYLYEYMSMSLLESHEVITYLFLNKVQNKPNRYFYILNSTCVFPSLITIPFFTEF